MTQITRLPQRRGVSVVPVALPFDAEALRRNGRRAGNRIALANCIGGVAVFAYLNALPAAGRNPVGDLRDLLFYAVEAIRGRPLSERAQEMGFRIGLGLVLMLMVFATYNDILHLAAS